MFHVLFNLFLSCYVLFNATMTVRNKNIFNIIHLNTSGIKPKIKESKTINSKTRLEHFKFQRGRGKVSPV